MFHLYTFLDLRLDSRNSQSISILLCSTCSFLYDLIYSHSLLLWNFLYVSTAFFSLSTFHSIFSLREMVCFNRVCGEMAGEDAVNPLRRHLELSFDDYLPHDGENSSGHAWNSGRQLGRWLRWPCWWSCRAVGRRCWWSPPTWLGTLRSSA